MEQVGHSPVEPKPGAIAPGLSLYLELLRLLAATEVVLFHLNGFPLLGGHRAPWNAFGHEAVVVFFVLSGFVIAFAAHTREHSAKAYAVSRLSRIYSDRKSTRLNSSHSRRSRMPSSA